MTLGKRLTVRSLTAETDDGSIVNVHIKRTSAGEKRVTVVVSAAVGIAVSGAVACKNAVKAVIARFFVVQKRSAEMAERRYTVVIGVYMLICARKKKEELQKENEYAKSTGQI